jgi:hypothetical protein
MPAAPTEIGRGLSALSAVTVRLDRPGAASLAGQPTRYGHQLKRSVPVPA